MHLRKRLTSTMENYLEAVLMLQEKNQIPRVKAISEMMQVSKPTVHSAIMGLVEQGYLRHEDYGHIELTAAGKKIAEEVYKGHKTLAKFLQNILRVDPELAEKEACGMEHAISSDTLRKFTQFIEFLEIGPAGKSTDCLLRFHEFSTAGKHKKCTQCKPE